MTEFVDETVRTATQRNGSRLYPLPRAEKLTADLKDIFSDHLGNLGHGGHFEAEGILVTGRSGSGKTKELDSLVCRFNASGARLPDGRPARIAKCLLKGVGGWKAVGTCTAKAIGYPIGPKSKLTQYEIWEIVVREARLRGIVGVHFDEVQHIFHKKAEADRLAILDAFKTLMKSHEWPLMLIFSGIPELEDHIQADGQLYRLLRVLPFEDVNLPEDYQSIHEIVGSYALDAGIEVDADLMTEDFLRRLSAAGAHRWGLIIKIAMQSITEAQKAGADRLERKHFVAWWTAKTKGAPAASPFLHRDFETIFRKDHPFVQAIGD
jgi:hypothetical protein